MEPTLEEIDDFNNHESEEKRKMVREVIVLCLGIGFALFVAANLFNTVPDYIGKTPIDQTNFNLPQMK
ncbi:MAG: hypothetical protein DSZ05_07495 [Sulfurospirillum sp.]|nr:MAG: hypothetical protein DSZ05_07495 [Sulfurospirillum sp.]